ncbi:hypothetical protein NRB_12020 [Novosphingobium sp. 11B]
MVRALAAKHGDKIELVGRANPFHDITAVDHGEVRDRKRLAEIFSQARALVFTSQMDNAPLTIIEALVAGSYIIAYHSPAAVEMLGLVGGRCVSSPDEALALIEAGREAELYGGVTHSELSARARRIWSGQSFTQAYLNTYLELIAACQERAA